MKYVLWDWNGTLFNDVTAGLNAANAMLRRRGIPEITMERYRVSFGFPVRNFYTAVGFRLEEEDWDAMAVEYHDLLRGDPSQRLREGALDALELVKSAGAGQSVISALRQDMLDADTAKAGIRGYMDRIYGVDNLDGATKLSRARELVAELKLAPGDAVMIGDTLHDLETAREIGAACILADVGHQSLAGRVPDGTPVAHSLLESARMALAMCGGII